MIVLTITTETATLRTIMFFFFGRVGRTLTVAIAFPYSATKIWVLNAKINLIKTKYMLLGVHIFTEIATESTGFGTIAPLFLFTVCF